MDDRTTGPPPDCESCGDTAELVLVQRIYLPIDLEHPSGPDDPETAAGDIAAGDIEWWCEVCRIHYPHQTT